MGGTSSKEPPANAGDLRHAGSIPGWGRCPEGGHSNPLQYSCLENPMDRGTWWATVHRVSKSQTWLKWLSMHRMRQTTKYQVFFHIFLVFSDSSPACMLFPLIFECKHYLAGFPRWLSGIESTCQAGYVGSIPGSERSPGEGKWQPTPVFLPEKCHGQRSLADYSPWGGKWVGHNWVTNQQPCLVLCAQSLSRVWFFATGMTYSPPGFSIHGIFQARMLEQVSIS